MVLKFNENYKNLKYYIMQLAINIVRFIHKCVLSFQLSFS